MRLVIVYALLAVIATAANIGAQDLALRIYGGAYAIGVSVLVGTLVGLLLKYVLDKRFIFGFQARSVGHDSKVFVLYAGVGGLTTLVFWGFEFSFHLMFGTREMRYLGGVIGLALGYLLKYQLDKRFVFRQAGSS